jgi:hypothetical protein
MEEHMPLIDNEARDRVRTFNGTLQKSLDPNLGQVVMTSGVAASSSTLRSTAIRKIATFDPVADGTGQRTDGAAVRHQRPLGESSDRWRSAEGAIAGVTESPGA